MSADPPANFKRSLERIADALEEIARHLHVDGHASPAPRREIIFCEHCGEPRLFSEAVPGFVWWCRACLADSRVPEDLRLKPSIGAVVSGRFFAPDEAARLRHIPPKGAAL